jgi:hypothetical protein
MRFIPVYYVVLAAVVSPVIADEDPTEPGPAFDSSFTAYKIELNNRLSWIVEAVEAHTESLVSALAAEDGNELIESEAGTLVWNASLGHVELWANDEEVSISRGVDNYGRLVFNGEDVNGYVDCDANDNVWMQISHDNVSQLWNGVFERDSITSAVIGIAIPQAKKQCTCKGSNDPCPRDNPQEDAGMPCWRGDACTNQHGNSFCKWLLVPVACSC